MDTSIGSDLEDELFVVRLLLDTVVLREVLDVADRSIDRVDSDRL